MPTSALDEIHPIAGQMTSVVDLVLHEVRRSILTGALRPGQALVVDALAEKLGVSHIPVREAIRQLHAQGLVHLSRGRSAIVAPLDSGDLTSIYQLRLCLEPKLAAEAARIRSKDNLDELTQIFEDMQSNMSLEEAWSAHRDFHTLLVKPAVGEWAFRYLSQLWDASERYTRLTFDPVGIPKNELRTRADNHKRLLTAARARDAEAIKEELTRHLERNQEFMLARLTTINRARTPSEPSNT